MRVCKAIATLVLAIAVTNSTRSIAQNGPPPTPPPPATVSSVGTIADANEPGDRLEISGQVFSPDGVTPASNVIVYAYQTDATGEYRNDPKTRVARLHGWAKTDAQGRYAFHTIKPASYPRMTIPAHVHFHVWGPGYPLQWTPELEFAGDKFLKPNQIAASNDLGKFANVQPLQAGKDGGLHCTFNIRISLTCLHVVQAPNQGLSVQPQMNWSQQTKERHDRDKSSKPSLPLTLNVTA